MRKLIAVHGLAGAGKDTFAEGLTGFHGFRRMAFADPLKRAVAEAFGISLATAFSADKDQTLPHWDMRLRYVLQQFGTEAMRGTFRDDFWVHRWLGEYRRIKDFTSVVLTDLRFENEADAIRGEGGHIVHITRVGAGLKGEAATHPSEAGITFRDGDIRVHNDGSIADLYAKASNVYKLLAGAE